MASNSFGTCFRFTTFGESHGEMMGVVIDGCPAGLELSNDDINIELKLRSPGQNEFISGRKENDIAKIVSGIFEKKTTGTPVTILIENKNYDSSKYEMIKDLYRPGHANYSYLKKYGIYDYRGGGRASARETVCRVAAGAVANKILKHSQIETLAYVKSIGNIVADINTDEAVNLKAKIINSALFCPDQEASGKIETLILKSKQEGDSIGGIVEFMISKVPAGLGDPVYEKFNAKLAYAMMSIPAATGFEIGEGFAAAKVKGSIYNDQPIIDDKQQVTLSSNHSGGILGGISTGMPIIGRVAFKPTPSIFKPQKSVNFKENRKEVFQFPKGAQHDPCVVIRAVPVVEAMCRIVIVDVLLLNRLVRI